MRLQTELRLPAEEQKQGINPGWQSRDYQHQACDAVFREFRDGVPATLAVMPTGTGKTYVAARIARTAKEEEGRATLFLVHRELLLRQAAATLASTGLSVAVEMASEHARMNSALFGQADVVCATVQSLQGPRLQTWDRDAFGLVVTDECHRAADDSHLNVYRHFDGAWHLGITATPDGCSARIGNVYRTRAYAYSRRQATLDGWLVPLRAERCKVAINLKDIRTTGGDFNAGDLADRIGPHVEYLADATRQRIADRQSVVFCPDVGSALAMAQALSGRGVPARHVAGTSGRFGMPAGIRRRTLQEFERREFQAVICCDLLFEGWDCRPVSAVVVARPTRLRYRYDQMAGRGSRICPETGKEDCLLVDFDWQCDQSSRDLVTAVDLVAAEDEDVAAMAPEPKTRVLADARKLLEKGTTDPVAALEEAKESQRRREQVPVLLAGVKADFEVEAYDPLNVGNLLGVKVKKRTDYLRPGYGEPPTPNMISYLKNAGVIDVQKLTINGAGKLIREIERRKKLKLASYAQVQALLSAGVGEIRARSLSAEQAGACLDQLKAKP